jgi:hypothetical protein
LSAWLFPVCWLPFQLPGGFRRIVWIAASMLVGSAGMYVVATAATEAFVHRFNQWIRALDAKKIRAPFDATGRLLASRDVRYSKVDAFLFERPLARGPRGKNIRAMSHIAVSFPG